MLNLMKIYFSINILKLKIAICEQVSIKNKEIDIEGVVMQHFADSFPIW